jgi:hypothetical protein
VLLGQSVDREPLHSTLDSFLLSYRAEVSENLNTAVYFIQNSDVDTNSNQTRPNVIGGTHRVVLRHQDCCHFGSKGTAGQPGNEAAGLMQKPTVDGKAP